MPRHGDDDLLALERGIEVRHDPYLPAGCVRSAVARGDGERLRRSSIFPALAKRA
jgi:hypothetical protein